jgi:opacity protein-like surface antigen
VASEYRDWVDGDDQPIEQTTAFRRAPLTASVRYYLKDRGRSIGSTAWIPSKVVPFVGVGFGAARYSFEQVGDFVDFNTLVVLPDRLTSSGWAPIFQGSGGVQVNLSRRLLLTGEMRYLRGSADASTPNRDYIGYRLDLSGLTTLVGLTLRL